MKKILTGLLAMFMGLTVAMAQTPATAKKEVKTTKAKTEKTVAATAPKIKKDGTPDKRFKENKKVAPAAGPVKKDGTPDKRFKTNNPNAGKKKKA